MSILSIHNKCLDHDFINYIEHVSIKCHLYQPVIQTYVCTILKAKGAINITLTPISPKV